MIEKEVPFLSPGAIHLRMMKRKPPTLSVLDIAYYTTNTVGINSTQGSCILEGFPLTWWTDKFDTVFTISFGGQVYRSDGGLTFETVSASLTSLVERVTKAKAECISGLNSDLR